MWRSIGQHRCFLLWKTKVEISSRKSANLTKAFHYFYIHDVMFIAIIIIYFHNDIFMTIIIIIIIIIIIQSISTKSFYYTHKRNFFLQYISADKGHCQLIYIYIYIYI